MHEESLEARYQHLCAQLTAIDTDLDKPAAGERQLTGAALGAVIAFLDADQSVFKSGIARPLKRLLAAASDAEQGAKPDLFKPRNVGSRPTRLAEHKPRGVTLGVLQQITLVGRSAPEAAKLVADSLWRRGVRDDNGKKIWWRTLLNQYRRIDKQPQDTQDVLRCHSSGGPCADC